MSDLPGDRWAPVLVGHQWPGSSALAILSAAAASRHAVGTSFHSYSDVLRSISQTVLADQEGAAAENLRASFRGGAEHAHAVAERNAAKKEALDGAHRRASELRSALSEIADRGSRQIRSIIAGEEPAPAKIARVVEVVLAAQTDADARAAMCMQEVYGSIQSVLDTCGPQTSAREFAHTHGVGPHSGHSSRHPDAVHRWVRDVIEADGASGNETTTAGNEMNRESGDMLPAIALGTVMRTEPSAPPEDRASPVSAPPAVQILPAGQSRPAAVIPTAPAPVTAAAAAARPLIGYGAGLRPTVPAHAGAPAAPASAPRHTAYLSGPTTTAAAVIARPAVVEAATADIRPTPDDAPLLALLHAVAVQLPGLRWAVSARADGSTVVATDLASGWIPPDIDLPTGTGLLEPAARTGCLTEWFGPGGRTVIHEPGRRLPSVAEPAPLTRSRPWAPVEELGWKLGEATRWRDGLPRLSHTLARAAACGLGFLHSEAELLRQHRRAAGTPALTAYPDAVDVGDWQLLTTIEALLDGETALAHYHFAWFEAVRMTPL